MIITVPDAPLPAQDPQPVSPPALCPNCGAKLGAVNLYCGGRGYVTYDVCQNPNPLICDYRKRQVGA